MPDYSITLIKNSNPVFISDYFEMVDRIRTKFKKIDKFDYCFEECPTTGRLHIHGMISTDTFKIYLRGVRTLINEGWSLDFGEVVCRSVWESYYTKCLSDQARLENKHIQLEQEYLDHLNGDNIFK